MKCPETPDLVELGRDVNGNYERSIGKNKAGKYRRFRFGPVKAVAQVECWNIWRRWEQRPEGCESWEELDDGEGEQERNIAILRRISAKGQERAAIVKAALKPAPDAPPTVTALGVTLADGKRLYLAAIAKRVGLIGSLGITQHTYDIIAYRIERSLAFLPPNIIFMKELTYVALETAIYAIAAKPKRLANPYATEATKKAQKKESVSQSTALAFVSTLKSFLLWCEEEETIGYTLPRHGLKLFRIRPEAEEQEVRILTTKELKTLWDGCVSIKARTKDKGTRRRLFLLLGINCGFYAVDISSLLPEHLKIEGTKAYIWKLRRKTRKTNSKLARTKWLLWPETKELLDVYMPLKVTPNQVRLAWRRLTVATGLNISHSHLRDTGAVFMERIGGRELADTYLAHSRKGVIDSYSHPDWDRLSNALQRFYDEFVKPAIGSPSPSQPLKPPPPSPT